MFTRCMCRWQAKSITSAVPNAGKNYHAPSIAKVLSSSEAFENADLNLNCFIRSVRKQKRVAFAAVGDGSTIQSLQAILTPEQAKNLCIGQGVRLSGAWIPSQGHGQSHELQVKQVTVVGDSNAEPALTRSKKTYPLQKKTHSVEYLRTMPEMRARLPLNALILRLRSFIRARLTQFFEERDFFETHTPLITTSDCEGAGDVFVVSTRPPTNPSTTGSGSEFFQTQTYLSVSSQLHLEALAQSLGKVWTLSPAFRAERSMTPRHLSEFYMLEAEALFVEDLESIMRLVEELVRSLVSSLEVSPIGKELLTADFVQRDSSREALQRRWDMVSSEIAWPRITFAEAVSRLEQAKAKGVAFEFDPARGIQAEHEKYIAKKGPVFITDYPRHMKPFYMMASQRGEENAACFDLIFPDVCEVAGGSLREHRNEKLEGAGKELEWYRNVRRWGSVPHGGFGLGFERLLAYLSGVPNLREVVAFPRWAGMSRSS
ncbi:MAG: asparaginyl-tRNA synthetase [Trizodia sp. TS-e1964]|nr:MAG: asparaginyl-tRNA synthetase [Trizodia sp. TS-e1964]